MNDNQKLLTWVAVGAVALTAFFAPWERSVLVGNEAIGTVTLAEIKAPLWDPPEQKPGRIRLRPDVLLLEWVAIGIVYAGLLAALKISKVSKSNWWLPPKAVAEQSALAIAELKSDCKSKWVAQTLNHPELQARLQALASQHGVMLASDSSLQNANGQPVAFQVFRDGFEDRVVRLNPFVATDVTPYQALVTVLIRYMKEGLNEPCRELVRQGEALFGGEVPFALACGVASFNRFNRPKGSVESYKEWWNDFVAYWRYALKKCTRDDCAKLVSDYLLNDMNTRKTYLGR